MKDAPSVPCEMIAIILAEADHPTAGQVDGGTHGFAAVASVIMNRVGETGNADMTLGVIMAGQSDPNPKHHEFAGVGTKRYNEAMDFANGGKLKGIGSAEYSRAARTAELFFTGGRGDTTDGATNFFAGRTPDWPEINNGDKVRKYPQGYHGNNFFFGPPQ